MLKWVKTADIVRQNIFWWPTFYRSRIKDFCLKLLHANENIFIPLYFSLVCDKFQHGWLPNGMKNKQNVFCWSWRKIENEKGKGNFLWDLKFGNSLWMIVIFWIFMLLPEHIKTQCITTCFLNQSSKRIFSTFS